MNITLSVSCCDVLFKTRISLLSILSAQGSRKLAFSRMTCRALSTTHDCSWLHVVLRNYCSFSPARELAKSLTSSKKLFLIPPLGRQLLPRTLSLIGYKCEIKIFWQLTILLTVKFQRKNNNVLSYFLHTLTIYLSRFLHLAPCE